MDWQRADQIITTHLGSVLVVVLVAVSGFVLGSQYKTSATEVAEESTEISASAESSTIQELQQLIADPTSQTTVSSETTSPVIAGLVNINSASLAQLETLPGIGPSKAQAIIEYRLKNGPFIRVEDLDKVSGIGPKTLEDLRPLITL